MPAGSWTRPQRTASTEALVRSSMPSLSKMICSLRLTVTSLQWVSRAIPCSSPPETRASGSQSRRRACLYPSAPARGPSQRTGRAQISWKLASFRSTQGPLTIATFPSLCHASGLQQHPRGSNALPIIAYRTFPVKAVVAGASGLSPGPGTGPRHRSFLGGDANNECHAGPC